MNNNLTKGLALFVGANGTAYISNYLRNNTENNTFKEAMALIEVVSHGISYSFYADAYIDSIKHIIDGEIVARLNKFNPTDFYIAAPYIGEVMVDDISDVLNINMKGNPFKYAAPYIAGYGLKYASKATLTAPIFSIWESFSHMPEHLPSPHIIGLISAISYNLINIPYLGKALDNFSNGNLTSIDEWKNHPGGKTYIGEFYRDYILYAWEKIHKPHHFYEEILSIDGFRENGESPIMGELNALLSEF